MVSRSNTTNYPTGIALGIEKKILFEKQLNEEFRDDPKP
jgi:hypothetical protein